MKFEPFIVIATLGLAAAIATATSAAEPRLPSIPITTPKTPEIQIHPKQPELPDLRNRAEEHGPLYTPPKHRFVGLFTPFRTERAALSPDGKYLAYTLREGDRVSIVVVAVDHPETVTAKVVVATDDTSTPMLAQNQAEKTPALVRWMRWTTPNRLVVDTNGAMAIGTGGDWSTRTGVVFGLDANGTNARLLASPRDVMETMINESAITAGAPRSSYVDWTPDQALPAASSDPAGTSDPTALAANPINDPLAPASTTTAPDFTTRQAQDIRVFDLSATNPDCVLLQTIGSPRGNGERHVGFRLLNTLTGKLQTLTDDILPGMAQGLTDRAGHLRVTLPVSLRARFPHRYEYLGATGNSRPHDLDQLSGPAGAIGFTVSPENFFGERAIPLGFDENPSILYYAANMGRDTFGVYSLDLATGKPGSVAFENPHFDLVPPVESFPDSDMLVFDRFTHRLAGVRYATTVSTAAWVTPVLQSVQKAVEGALTGRSVDILEWDESLNRFLVLASAPGDAGAFYIFDRATTKLSEFVRRAPWLDANHTHRTYAFTFKTTGALPLMGVMTLPSHPRINPVPVVMVCPEMPWQRVSLRYNQRVQALAEMGFLVVQWNGRGTWGFGKTRRNAIEPGYDDAQIEDLLAALDYVSLHFKVDPKRVAVMGDTHGGFLALRAVQLHPDRFRCAIAMNALIDIAAWLDEKRWTEKAAGPLLTRGMFGTSERLRISSLSGHADAVKRPVFLLHYPGPDGTPRASTYITAKNFASAAKKNAGDSEFADLTTDYMKGFPNARSDTYQEIENFLNATVYDYKVKMGDTRVQPDTTPKR